MTPLREISTPVLRKRLAVWKLRRAARSRQLTKTQAIRTSNTPRTKLTPKAKVAQVAVEKRLVRQADLAILAVNEALAWRQMPVRARALSVARTMLDVRERGGNNRGREVEAIIRKNGGKPGEAWCGDFVAACYLDAGSKAVTRAWAAVRSLGRITGMRVMSGIRSARAGDIIVFSFDHTGLIVGYCNASGRVMARGAATHIRTIEGNTGASGARSDSVAGGDGVHERIRDIGLAERMVRVTR